MPEKPKWKSILPDEKAIAPKPLTAISAAIGNRDVDSAIWATLSLYLWELNHTDGDTHGMKMLLKDLSKILLDIKKSNGASDGDKEKMLAELMAFIKDNDASTE
tara:strand:+ start:611 stop:922 length:312 start_codon:yes stop_codon:yes gene_type:complete